MNQNTETDIFKEAVKAKIGGEEPLRSLRDQELWDKVLAEISSEKKESAGTNYYLWYASAAAAVLLFVAVSLFFLNTGTGETEQSVALTETNTIQIAPQQKEENQIEAVDQSPVTEMENTEIQENEAGEQPEKADFSKGSFIASETNVLDHSLSDGSVVSLNANASIKIAGNFSQVRELMLEGEAYFEVQPDKTMPFIVHFGDYKVEVVGTKFNILNSSGLDYKEVTVTEGIVRVFSPENKNGVELRNGDQIRFYKNSHAVLSKVDGANYISWKTGVLEFKKARLKEVGEILSRRFGVEVQVDQEIANCRYTGDLSELNFEDAMNIISMTASVKFERTKDKINVSGKGCN